MRLWNKRYVDLKVEELIEKNIQIVNNIANIDRTYKGRTEIKDIKLQPYTIVNLLGKYGDFEVDSDGNGIGDGWTDLYASYNINEIVDSPLGGKAQKQICSNGNTSFYYGTIAFFLKGHPKENHKYFLSFYGAKSSDTLTAVVSVRINNAGYRHHYLSTKFDKIYDSFSFDYSDWNNPPYDYNRIIFSIYNEDGSYAYIDKVMFVDLTEMGALPSGIKAYFQNAVAKWEDLVTSSNIAAIDGREQTGNDWLAELLPYVNSVATLGWKWGE
ncbi:hypothetical protein LN42_00605 [Marinitoga sp. 1137]|uniref:hypothetical protein n=1 Tax=Marinitoga sp. 1137 TaxID=1545835 RepID=UPI0009505C72|nr:hypothetical protein [Marinitoga sp. 1137]APT75061.1 hypothetical protein LN42_00605 [Marinitoga sp. 1137]